MLKYSWTGSTGKHITFTYAPWPWCVCVCGTYYLIYLFAHVTPDDISYTVRSNAVKFSDCMNSIVYSIFLLFVCFFW